MFLKFNFEFSLISSLPVNDGFSLVSISESTEFQSGGMGQPYLSQPHL